MSAKEAGRRLTVRDIARLADTSKSTVSRVFNGSARVSDGVRRRVLEVARRHGYRPSAAARALSRGRNGFIGIMAAFMQSGYFADVVQGADLAARAHGLQTLSTFGHNPEEFDRLWHEYPAADLVDGLVLVSPPESVFAAPSPHDLPTVLVGSQVPDDAGGWEGVAWFAADNRGAILTVMDRAWDRGARRMVHVAGPDALSSGRERRLAYEEFCGVQDLEPTVLWSDRSRKAGRRAVRDYLDAGGEPEVAFIAWNDQNALAVLEVFSERGLGRPPLVTGVDGRPEAGILGIPSMRQPAEAMARRAVDWLSIRIADPATPVVAERLAMEPILDVGQHNLEHLEAERAK